MYWFSVREAKSVAHIDYGGAKILKFTRIHNSIITVSAPKGGQTPLPTLMGEPWPDLPPLDPPLVPYEFKSRLSFNKNADVTNKNVASKADRECIGVHSWSFH